MSGSNTICVATVLRETGMVEMREPETTLRLVPAIRGSAWITGIHQVFVDPADPFPMLSDTWPGPDVQQ